MNLKPTKENVLIERIESQKQIGSIVLPDSAIDAANKGKVLNVVWASDEVPEFSTNDIVVFRPHSFLTEVVYENNKFYFINKKDILGVIS